MRVALISDLHYDSNEKYDKQQYFNEMKKISEEEDIDTWIIGGDISNSHTTTIDFVESLQSFLGEPVYFVPGNHDYWEVGEAEKNTWKIYKRFVEHPQCLMEKPLELNDDTVLIGHSAWYNYAFSAKKFSDIELERGVYRDRTWQDKLNLDWGKDDKTLSKEFASIVTREMEQHKDKKMIVLTHMVTIPEFSVKLPHETFDYFNAFIGTDDFDSLFKQHSPAYVAMGHIHYRGKIKKGLTNYICCCLGYVKEWKSDELYTELKQATYILNI